MRSTQRRLVTISSVVVLAVLAVVFIFTHLPPQAVQQGSSSFASLDIVSGEVSVKSHPAIIDITSEFTGQKLDANDLQVRTDTYKKFYDTNGIDYSVTFDVDIEKAHSSLIIGIQYIGGSMLPITIGCAEQQKDGYACIDMGELDL